MFEKGNQPCNNFKPTDSYLLHDHTHWCPICDSERVFCTNCNKDHHKNGWETCKK